MEEIMIMQGRELRGKDLDLIRNLMVERPDWGRTRLSEELCRRWDWCNEQGRIKDMAARTLRLKLKRIFQPQKQASIWNNRLIW